ncbi:MAK10-like protein [Tanacetum coccineum]
MFIQPLSLKPPLFLFPCMLFDCSSPGAYLVGNTLRYQDLEWSKALKNGKLKDEALKNKAIMVGIIDDDESHNEDEEYVAIKENEYDDLTSTNEDACRTYQEIFRRMDEGWMDLARKEIDKVGEVSIIWNPMCVVVMLSIFSSCYLFRNPFLSTTLGDENPIRTLGDYSKPSHEGYRNTIELPAGNNVVRKLNLMLESLGLVPQSPNTKFVYSKEDDGEVMFIEIIRDDDEPQNEGPNKGEGVTTEEPVVEYFDTFPTKDELTYHRYLLSGSMPLIFLRNHIITKGCPYNLKIPCNIGHVHIEKAYIDLNSPLNIMTQMIYNWIMRRKLDPKENTNRGVSNFTGRIKGMHVFTGNFTYNIDFMIVEDISSIIDPRLSQVVLGRPFIEISNMTHDHPKELNKEDKRRGVEYVMNKILGFYKECLELRPEYLTGVDDGGEVTLVLALSDRHPTYHETSSDRAPLQHRHAFEAVDRTFRDICKLDNPNAENQVFGRKVVVLGGGFRQILQVIPNAPRAVVVTSVVNKSSSILDNCRVFVLSINMHLRDPTIDVAHADEMIHIHNLLMSMEDGRLPSIALDDKDVATWITIPNDLLIILIYNPIEAIVSSTYPYLPNKIHDIDYLKERCILSPTKIVVDKINSHVLDSMSGDMHELFSADMICSTSDNLEEMQIMYPPKFQIL